MTEVILDFGGDAAAASLGKPCEVPRRILLTKASHDKKKAHAPKMEYSETRHLLIQSRRRQEFFKKASMKGAIYFGSGSYQTTKTLHSRELNILKRSHAKVIGRDSGERLDRRTLKRCTKTCVNIFQFFWRFE